MVKEVICKNCLRPGHYRTFCPVLKRAPIKAQKRIKRVGRAGQQYIEWRDEIAIPYLDRTFGHKCSIEGCKNTNLDVAHILGRGAYPKSKMLLDNIRYLCRNHHLEEHHA